MKRVVLDASALLLYVYGDITVKRIVEENEAFVNPVNLTEFLYVYARTRGWKEALLKYSAFLNSLKVAELSEGIITLSAKLKLKYDLSLGDAFLLATAKYLNGTAVTSDHELAKVKEVKVLLLNPPSDER